ncbi:MAG: hypothetical protein R3315_06465 [Woeseiaceae bacterium]|nr:hypothetical protein [Woeseiaceae bacterium]
MLISTPVDSRPWILSKRHRLAQPKSPHWPLKKVSGLFFVPSKGVKKGVRFIFRKNKPDTFFDTYFGGGADEQKSHAIGSPGILVRMVPIRNRRR